MFELVPSQFMRKYYNEIGFEFTDFQKAALIWNTPGKTRQEILGALKALAEITEDVITKKQILERIDFEEKLFDSFTDNISSKYVYVVEDSEDGCSCGFFADYHNAAKYALKYANKYETKCSIQKQLIVIASQLDENCDYDGAAVGEATLNEKGEIENLWSCELSKDLEAIADECKTDRFEYPFIKVPFDLQVGTSVKNVVSGTYGILAQGKEDWDKYLQDIEEKKLDVDFSDIQVIVYELTESGYWSHEHINPMYLDVDFPPHIQEDKRREAFRRATKAFSDYLSSKSKGIEFAPDLVLKYAREYASICNEKSHWEKIVDVAKTPEELMW